jgi:hypothetical protein
MTQWLLPARIGTVNVLCLSLEFGRVNASFGMSKLEITVPVRLHIRYRALFKMRIISTIFLSLFFFAKLSSVAEGQSQNLSMEFKKIFTNEEIKTINRIIEFYDSIVFANTSNHNSIGEAYSQYLDSLRPFIHKNGDDKVYAIPEKIRTSFFSSLNQQHLKEIYEIHDSINYYWRGEYKTIHSPYILDLQYPGKYVDFLKILSGENGFLNDYYDNVVATHALSPSCFASVMELYKDLDLNNKFYRLVVIINLLMIDGLELK